MDKGFSKYKEELEQVKLTQDSKRALVQALARHETGTEKRTKRPPKRIRTVLVAAILLLGAMVLTAAAVPGFWSMLGMRFSLYNAEDGQTRLHSYDTGGTECPIEVAEGRVWFTFDGQHIDITGQFDDERAYVYEMTNPETGLPDYILVGWSAGGIGYGEIVFMPEVREDGTHYFVANTLGVVHMDPDYPIFEHTYAPEPASNDWFVNAVEEICEPYLKQIRPRSGTYETQPPMTDTAAPDMTAAFPTDSWGD